MKSKGKVGIENTNYSKYTGEVYYDAPIDISETLIKQVEQYLLAEDIKLKTKQGEGNAIVQASVTNNRVPFTVKTTDVQLSFGKDFVFSQQLKKRMEKWKSGIINIP
jgi:hypothetical protein